MSPASILRVFPSQHRQGKPVRWPTVPGLAIGRAFSCRPDGGLGHCWGPVDGTPLRSRVRVGDLQAATRTADGRSIAGPSEPKSPAGLKSTRNRPVALPEMAQRKPAGHPRSRVPACGWADGNAGDRFARQQLKILSRLPSRRWGIPDGPLSVRSGGHTSAQPMAGVAWALPQCGEPSPRPVVGLSGLFASRVEHSFLTQSSAERVSPATPGVASHPR
jgi:hypothetical protein